MVNINDEWNGLADFLAGIIEKYAEKMELDTLPNPNQYYRQKQLQDTYRRYLRLSARERMAS